MAAHDNLTLSVLFGREARHTTFDMRDIAVQVHRNIGDQVRVVRVKLRVSVDAGEVPIGEPSKIDLAPELRREFQGV
jgi:hypothetical protein